MTDSEVQILAATAVWSGSVILAPLIYWRLRPLLTSLRSPSASWRVCSAIAVSVAVSGVAAIVVRVQYPGLQTFASGGLVKRIAIPALLIVFLVAVLGRHEADERRLPMWWWMIASVGCGSSLIEIIFRRDLDVVATLQGLVLVAVFLVCSACGVWSGDWEDSSRTALCETVVWAGLCDILLGGVLQPFVALAIPATAVAIVMAFRGPRRLIYAVVSSVMVALVASDALVRDGREPLSIAVGVQIVAAGVLVAISICSPFVRRALLVVGTIATVFFAANSPLISLLRGSSAFSDVTLAHRGYETAVVFRAVFIDPAAVLIGLGPGATVNLIGSPDAATLLASGRDLAAVDDVHLLTSWFLLKFGILGVLTLCVYLTQVLRLVWRVSGMTRIATFDLALVLVAVSGVAASLPAATNFLVNPLMSVAVGILFRQYSTGRSP